MRISQKKSVFVEEFKIKQETYKEFLKTNYPRGSPDSYRDIDVFRWFYTQSC